MTPERWREVEAILRAALARPPEARAAFVSAACRGDANLRHEVEELLAVRTEGFLANSPGSAFAAAADVAIYTRLSAALAGRYVLDREVGRGGMATVYLARDLRHERNVAVKVLHGELAAVVGAARFLAEIRTTAALQHPHILPLFDSGATDGDGGLLYYVMPFVVGETLRGRLTRERQLPVGDALRIATEVASALEYAHRHGVIHRDIKPENILLGEDGHALVADFGIALAITHAAGGRLTQSGLSLGTPQYMAPEQAAGERSVDARADIYSLGVVTYEMLAGEPPFRAPTTQAVIARMMTESPRPLASQRPSVPPHMDIAVRAALEKLPADRFASASGFAAALATPSPDVGPPVSVATPSTRWTRSMAAALASALLAGAALLGWGAARWGGAHQSSGQRRSAHAPVVRFTIGLDSGFFDYFSDPAISPDGRTIVYAADGPDGARLYARRLEQLDATSMTGTEDGRQPFFSPDGEWVAFFSHGELRKTRMEGGAPMVVTAVTVKSTASSWSCGWDKDDIITCGAIAAASAALFRVPASGGRASRVHLADTTALVLQPHPLPGARAILVTVADGPLPSQTRVGVLDLATGRVRQFGAGQGARYVGGVVVYASADGELLRQSFDLDRLEPIGAPERVTNDLETFYAGRPGFDVSETGALVYSPSTSGLKSRLTLTVTDRAGRTDRVIAARMPWVPRFSPDGRRVAYGALGPGQHNGDVWLTDLGSGTTQRLTTDDREGSDPQWSRDGRTIAYSAYTSTGMGKRVIVQTPDGGAARTLTHGPGTQWPSDWTPDGRGVLFTDNRDSVGPGGQPVRLQQIWIQPLDGTPARPYITSPTHERGARVSADGHWAAYVSDETGRDEVYVQSYPTRGHKLLVSAGGGDNPVWRRNGRELYYWHADTLVAVTFDAQGTNEPLEVRGRTSLFRAPYVQHSHPNYDVSPDGTRFVLVTGNTRGNRLVVALNVLGASSTQDH
jgi:serine/threonine-protein kinase